MFIKPSLNSSPFSQLSAWVSLGATGAALADDAASKKAGIVASNPKDASTAADAGISPAAVTGTGLAAAALSAAEDAAAKGDDATAAALSGAAKILAADQAAAAETFEGAAEQRAGIEAKLKGAVEDRSAAEDVTAAGAAGGFPSGDAGLAALSSALAKGKEAQAGKTDKAGDFAVEDEKTGAGKSAAVVGAGLGAALAGGAALAAAGSGKGAAIEAPSVPDAAPTTFGRELPAGQSPRFLSISVVVCCDSSNPGLVG